MLPLYVKVPPDKAMVVLDRKGSIKTVISGGGKYLNPFTEMYRFLPIDVRTLDLNARDVVTTLGDVNVVLNLRCVTQVKVSSRREGLTAAAESLLEMTDEEFDQWVNDTALKALEGQLRGLARNMNPASVNFNRDVFSNRVRAMSNMVLARHGIDVRSFFVKVVEDEHGYQDRLLWGRLDVFVERIRSWQAEFDVPYWDASQVDVSDIVRWRSSRPTAEEVRAMEGFACPFCAQVQSEDAKSCVNCGMDIARFQAHKAEMEAVSKRMEEARDEGEARRKSRDHLSNR
jgi:hypothetical protein